MPVTSPQALMPHDLTPVPSLPLPDDSANRFKESPWATCIGLMAMCLMALMLRTFGTNTPFPSNDHVQLPYFVSHYWGWYWCFQTHYGPIQPIITKAFALLLTSFDIPMTEALWRLPMALLGSLLPLLSYAIVRQISMMDRRSRADSTAAAWTAAIWTTVLPPLVTDARYTWAYETLGVFCAALTLWMLLVFLHKPTPTRCWMTGICLSFYLMSHLLVYAVPCVVLLMLIVARRRQMKPATSFRRWLGLLIPPMCVAALMVVAHARLGGGVIERVSEKFSLLHMPARHAIGPGAILDRWLGHAGWLFGAMVVLSWVCCLGRAVRLRDGWSVLMGWSIIHAAPLLILTSSVGRPSQYFLQSSYAATLFTAAVLVPAMRRFAGAWIMRIGIGVPAATLALGAVDQSFFSGHGSHWTGVTAAWGASQENLGIKPAGWYVRRFVPAEAVVCTLHDSNGLEMLQAGYYMGRQCLAFSDLPPALSVELFEHYRPLVDVLVCERRLNIQPTWMDEFPLVATVVRDTTENGADRERVDIYARRTLKLPEPMGSAGPMILPIEEYDRRYDEEFGVRQIGVTIHKPEKLPRYSEVRAWVLRDGWP